MIPVEHDGVPFFRFSSFSGDVRICHGIFTRQGGVSPAPYADLNVGFGLGDSDRNVGRNRGLVGAALGGDRLVFAKQTHSTKVLVYCRGEGDGPPRNALPPVGDALVTDVPGLLLAIQVADCQPVLIHDPERGVVAGVHSGWRGSIANILGRTVSTMAERFGSRPESLVAGIGPSLGPCCAEFIHYRQEIPSRFWVYKDGQDRFDFWALSRDQLLAAGLRAENIEVSGQCTRCRPDLFFSFRHAPVTGRFAAVIGLEKNGSARPTDGPGDVRKQEM